MSILSSIKGEKKLSFGHWRYRLLHWCFNVKNPDPCRPQDTGLPKFLYTHYCPLFHLTNLIALLSPLVLLAKVTTVIVKAIIEATSSINWSKLSFLVDWMKRPDVPLAMKIKTADEERMEAILIFQNYSSMDVFDIIWSIHGKDFNILKKEEVEELFKEFMPKIIEARLQNKLRKDRIREKLIFWTNFSRVFIKWGLNLFYIALTCLLLYVIYLAIPPVWYALCYIANGILWLFTDEGSLEFLKMFVKTMVVFSIGIGSLILLHRVGWLQSFGTACSKGMMILSPPFYLIGKFGSWVANGFSSFLEFASMFYEENCPPITIISEEEAVIQKIIEKDTE